MAVKTYAGNKNVGDTTVALFMDDGTRVSLGQNYDMNANDVAQLSTNYILLDGVVNVDLSQFPWYTAAQGGNGSVDNPFYGYAHLDQKGNALNGVGQILQTALIVNVKDFGAKVDGTTNDTSALATALAAVSPNPIIGTGQAGVVIVPAGTLLTDPFVLSQRTGIIGVGPMSSNLKMRRQGAAQFEKFITNLQNYSGVNDAQGCMVANMRVQGDKYSVTANGGGFYNGNADLTQAGNWHDAIVFKNDTPSSSGLGYEYTDGRHVIENVHVETFRGNGVVVSGRGDTSVRNVKVWDVDGFAFNMGVDNYMSDVDAGGSGLDGFLFQGNCNVSNAKSWFSGSKLVTSRGVNATSLASQPQVFSPPPSSGMTWNGSNIVGGVIFSLTNGFGNGALWLTISGSALTGNNSGGTYVIAAQDNARAGLYIRGGRQTIMFESDSNNNNGTSDGTKTGTPVGSYAGIEVAGSNNKIMGTSWDRAANVNQQAAALKITSAQTGNQVDVNFFGGVNDGSNMPPLTSDSTTDNNVVRIRNNEANWRNASFASTVTVDPWTNKTHAYTLTGPMTISAPALSGTNTAPGIFMMKGMELRFVLAQNSAGGNVPTFNAIFKTAGAIPTTANSVTIVEFIYDGTNWRECSRATS